MDTLLKAALAILALCAGIACLAFAWSLYYPYADEIDPTKLQGWIWTGVGIVAIPLMVIAATKMIRSLLR
jgi:hypothetical protein